MTYTFTSDDRDPWTQARWTGVDSDIHPQAPAGGGGPGYFTQAGTLGIDPGSGGLHPNSPAAGTYHGSGIVLCSTATTGVTTGDVLPVRIGSIYKLEGFIDNDPVVYIGKSNDIKRRFLKDAHKWKKLVEDSRTKISMRRVYGDLDVKASKRGTPASATNEALRVEEEKALRETEAEVEAYNKDLKPGEPPKRVLNDDRAASEENLNKWRPRHNVTGDEEWTTIRTPGSSEIVFRSFIALQVLQIIIDAIFQERNQKMARYVWAPYVFLEADGQTSFTVRREPHWMGFSATYKKHYLTGALAGKDVEITYGEYEELKDEAEALYGYVDFWGDFVPGMLMPKLPEVEIDPRMRA